MRLMVDANISEVFIGIETPNEAALRETKKIQNLRDRGGTMLEKVHRIQETGIEVWCGIIVGFDHDDADLRRTAAICRRSADRQCDGQYAGGDPGPRFTRGSTEKDGSTFWRPGRLRPVRHQRYPSPHRSRSAARRLCRADAGSLYAGRLFWAARRSLSRRAAAVGPGRRRHLRHHPLRRFKLNLRLLAEALGIFVMLMRGVSDARCAANTAAACCALPGAGPHPLSFSFTRWDARCISMFT